MALASGKMASAQLTLAGQLRTRTEFRDGQGAPLPMGSKPAFFTSQRTRLSLGYSAFRLKFGLTAQDIRVWGQDVSTINRTTTQDNNGIMLHEAWAEILLSDTSMQKKQSLSLKLGRQELLYDDSRLLGNLDWLQQGRRHDAVILKYETTAWTLHLAGAFNQNKENSAGTIFNGNVAGNYAANTNGGAMYKSMQFLYAGRKLQAGNISFLFFADQFGKFHSDTLNSQPVKTFESGTWTRMTTGIYFINAFRQLNTTAAAYYQFGKNAVGQDLNAYLLHAAAQYTITKKLSAGGGIDYTSGGSNGSTSKAFDPLYGTPHKFWGAMDYFYAASGFGKGGLADYYLKGKFKLTDKYTLAAELHRFNSAAPVNVAAGFKGNRKYLGSELDLIATATITRQISLEGGYGHFFGRPLLATAAVKNVPNADLNSNWAYVMINIKPDFLFK